jgi:hypothetical protein
MPEDAERLFWVSAYYQNIAALAKIFDAREL